MDGKGGKIQNLLLDFHADVLIFLEVVEAGMDYAEIYALQRNIILQKEAEERKTPGPMSDFIKGSDLDNKLENGVKETGYGPIRTRRKHMFRSAPFKLRLNKLQMASISQAVEVLSDAALQDRSATLMRLGSIADILKTAEIPPILKVYPYWLASESLQHHRSYLVFSKIAFEHSYIDVDIASAKRQILCLELKSGQTVYAIHAPSFGKGGADTVFQLVDIITKTKSEAIAVGDMNIDLDEIWTEVEIEGVKQTYSKLFTSTNIIPIGPPEDNNNTPHKRRWHPNKADILKKYPKTKKSGGTLDYALAGGSLKVQTEIVIQPAPEGISDHAAILVTIPGW